MVITTKYLPATNHNGSRVVATCRKRRKLFNWDHALNAWENHEVAALTLLHEISGSDTTLRLAGDFCEIAGKHYHVTY